MELKLTLMLNDEETDLGESHILGCPDVPAKWNDDAVFFNDEVFVGQINLKDVSTDLLPKQGILYFFFASMSKPYRGIVRYTNDLETLERVDFNEEVDFKANFNQEFKIEINDSNNDIEILGKMPKFKHYKPTQDEVCLLKLDFKNYPSIDLFNDVDEQVCYLIKKDDLLNGRFDKAYLSLTLN